MVTEQPAAPSRFAVRPWMVVLAACLIYLTWVFVSRGADPLAFVTLAQPPSTEYPEGYDGYDGQFTYYIALNPVQSPPHLDVPAYRLQRILLPLLGFLLSFGQPALVPWVLLAVNVAALIAGTVFLERLLAAENASRWYALAYGLSAGVFMPVRLSLTEPLAYGLVLAAIWFDRRGRLWFSAVLFMLSALAKEPTLIFVAAYVLLMLAERRWPDAVRLGLIAGLPFLGWQIVLTLWLGAPGVGAGGDLATPFEAIPYMGFFRIYTDSGSLAVFLLLAGLVAPTTIIPSLWGLIAGLRDVIRRRRDAYVFAMLANSAVIAFLPFSTFREPLGILRFIPGLIVSMLLYAARYRHRAMLRYSVLWLSTVALAISSG